jgi:hypothetical protein
MLPDLIRQANYSENDVHCCASNLILSKDVMAATIACHAAVSSPRRSLMISEAGSGLHESAGNT